MKKLTLIFALLSLVLAAGCDDDDDTNNGNNVNNTNSTNQNNVNNTTNNTNNTNSTNELAFAFADSGCKGNTKKSIDDFSTSGFECVYWSYDGVSELELVHVNAIYNCCPDETLGMTGEVTLSGSELTITGSDNGGMCNCVCPYDLSYSISNIAPGTYDVNAAPMAGPMELVLESAGEGMFCEDMLTSYSHCEGEGQRGSFCEDATSCMAGDGYCLDVSGNPLCVNTCDTAEDCPMPDLEECLDDGTGITYCSPTTL